MLEYVRDMRLIAALSGPPTLQSLAALQDAFYSADEDFETCNLPATIESINIVDSTYEAKRYTKHVLDHQAHSPNLKLVKLGEGTYNHMFKHPDGSDSEEANEAVDAEWRRLFQIDDSIYEHAKSCGMKVEKAQDRTA